MTGTPPPITRSPRDNVSVKTLVFDLDGTLVDSFDDIVLSFQYAFRTLGLPLPASGAVRAQLWLAGSSDGRLRASWSMQRPLARARLDGKFNTRRLRAVMLAP